jgi:acetyl esterase/lipase
MPLEPAYANKLHLLDNATPGDWTSLAPFFADDHPYEQPPVSIEQITIPGEVSIPARVYSNSKGLKPGANALVWFHGGAFVGGDLDMGESHFVSAEIASSSNTVVITVDYRLCNDGITFPAPQNDAVAAITWVQQNRERLGIGGKIFTGGGSAGACLAGSAVQMLRDQELEQVAGALLVYPVAHAGSWEFSAWQKERLAELPPVLGFEDSWRSQHNARVMGKPLEEATGYDFPGETTELAGLPPHFILNCEYDDLAPSGEQYALQLAHAGVPVTLVTELGVPHGHLNKNPREVSGTRNTLASMINYLDSI